MINLLSLAYAAYSEISQRGISAGSAIICPTHKPSNAPVALLSQKFLINSEKKLWVSTMCAQILVFSRVRVRVRVSLV